MKLRRLIGTRGWQNNVWADNKLTPVIDLLKNGECIAEYDGSSAQGWFVMLRTAKEDTGVTLSPFFGRDQGDTLRDLKAAFCRAYGDIKLTKGRKAW